MRQMRFVLIIAIFFGHPHHATPKTDEAVVTVAGLSEVTDISSLSAANLMWVLQQRFSSTLKAAPSSTPKTPIPSEHQLLPQRS